MCVQLQWPIHVGTSETFFCGWGHDHPPWYIKYRFMPIFLQSHGFMRKTGVKYNFNARYPLKNIGLERSWELFRFYFTTLSNSLWSHFLLELKTSLQYTGGRMRYEKDPIVYFTKLKRDISAKTFIFLVKRFANLKCTEILSEEFP